LGTTLFVQWIKTRQAACRNLPKLDPKLDPQAFKHPTTPSAFGGAVNKKSSFRSVTSLCVRLLHPRVLGITVGCRPPVPARHQSSSQMCRSNRKPDPIMKLSPAIKLFTEPCKHRFPILSEAHSHTTLPAPIYVLPTTSLIFLLIACSMIATL
jgi:hypothetical protein